MANSALTAARAAKKDEFYTQLTDIERELAHYKEHFKGKTVLCNCDDPRVSNFFKYFTLNFEYLGLKIDQEKNEGRYGQMTKISAEDSAIEVYIIPADEMTEMVRQAVSLVAKQ